MVLPNLSLSSPSASQAQGAATSGGTFALGGNPNLALLTGGGNGKWWALGIGAAALAGLWIWRHK